jgi:hypothetical protein
MQLPLPHQAKRLPLLDELRLAFMVVEEITKHLKI